MSVLVKKNQVRPIVNQVPSNMTTTHEFLSTTQDLHQANEVSAPRTNKVKDVMQSTLPKKGYKRRNISEIARPVSQQSNKIIVLDNNELEFTKPIKQTAMVAAKTPNAVQVKAITKKVVIESNQKAANEQRDALPTNANTIPSPLVTGKVLTTSSKIVLTDGSNENRFQCATCNRTFKRKELLTQHVKLHAGVRPFKCTEEGCEKAFSRKEHLHRHLISHTGKKLFHCDFCDKPFSRKDNLSKHRR